MPPSPSSYMSPSSQRLRVATQPRLASWNSASSPDQVKLSEYLDQARSIAGPALDSVDGPAAVRLDVGLPESVRLLTHHDLDNYAFPLAIALSRGRERQIVSVRCTKQHAVDSWLSAGAAVPALSQSYDRAFEVRTAASAATAEYKRQIHSGAVRVPMLQAGAVALDIAFAVSPRRNWMNLWKPTIDSLDPLLGRTNPTRQWHPLDGRITELGLHCTYDSGIGNDVALMIGARSIDQTHGPATRLVAVPDPSAAEYELNEFALTYNAYAVHDDLETVAKFARYTERRWQQQGRLADDLDTLRTTLFFLQRQLHHSDGPMQLRDNPLVAALLERIRDCASEGVPIIGGQL